VRRICQRQELREPGLLRFHADLVEACVRIGDQRSAEQALAELEEQATITGRRWARLAALRSRAMLADGSRADASLDEAVAVARTCFSVRRRSRPTSATPMASSASDPGASWRACSRSSRSGPWRRRLADKPYFDGLRTRPPCMTNSMVPNRSVRNTGAPLIASSTARTGSPSRLLAATWITLKP